MANKKRTTVTIETRQRTVVRRRGGQTVVWCKQCRAEVLMLTPEEAATLARTTARAIFRRVEPSALHFAEDLTGRVLVCFNSLQQCSETEASPTPARQSDPRKEKRP